MQAGFKFSKSNTNLSRGQISPHIPQGRVFFIGLIKKHPII